MPLGERVGAGDRPCLFGLLGSRARERGRQTLSRTLLVPQRRERTQGGDMVSDPSGVLSR